MTAEDVAFLEAMRVLVARAHPNWAWTDQRFAALIARYRAR